MVDLDVVLMAGCLYCKDEESKVKYVGQYLCGDGKLAMRDSHDIGKLFETLVKMAVIDVYNVYDEKNQSIMEETETNPTF